ncbi:MAG: hypothetical protein ACK526_03130 [Planctomyces sp.]|jgi:hypothetical protein
MNRTQWIFQIVLLAALCARISVVLLKSEDLKTDPDGYIAHARMISEGKGLAGPYTSRPTAFRPPGYPYLLAFWSLLSADSARNAAMINVLAGLLCVLLTRILAEQTQLNNSATLIASTMVAFDPLLVRYSALPMTEVLSSCMITASLVLFLRCCRQAGIELFRNHSASADQTPAPGRIVVFTCVFFSAVSALSTLVRPAGLPVFVLQLAGLVVIRLMLRENQQGHPESTSRSSRLLKILKLPAVMSLFFVLAMSPWIVRNYRVFHRLIPATTHGGYTLALGNNQDYYRDVVRANQSAAWDGAALNSWQKRIDEQARADGVDPGDEPGMDAWMYQLAFRSIREDPAGFAGACILRLRRFFGVSTLESSGIPDFLKYAVAVWYSGLWLMLAVAFLRWLRGRTDSGVSFLWLTVAAVVLIHTFFWTDARMRAPVTPILCVLAASVFSGRRSTGQNERQTLQDKDGQTADSSGAG